MKKSFQTSVLSEFESFFILLKLFSYENQNAQNDSNTTDSD